MKKLAVFVIILRCDRQTDGGQSYPYALFCFENVGKGWDVTLSRLYISELWNLSYCTMMGKTALRLIFCSWKPKDFYPFFMA